MSLEQLLLECGQENSLKSLALSSTCFYYGGGKSAPKPPAPPLPTDAARDTNASIDPSGRRKRGSGSTILTSGQGVTDQTSKKTILGG